MSTLQNLKVLDFSTLLPGPYATMMLADMGADVLRIESPTRPDLIRTIPPIQNGTSVAHSAINRNKRSITLDLKKPEAVAIVEKLVKEYDIIIEQFRPGVMDKLGVGYDHLKTINPKLIYCSVTGYGQFGPYKDRAGHDNNYLSIGGVNAISGRPGTRTPIMGTQIADIAGGSLHGVIGILAAVNHRAHTGEGQYVDISMTDAVFTMNAVMGSAYVAAGEEPIPCGSLLNGGSYYEYYETADARFMSVGSIEPQFFQRLCETLACKKYRAEELIALGRKTDPDSVSAFNALVAELFLQKTQAEWIALFAQTDACVEPVLSYSESVAHEQIVARELVVDVPTGNGKSQRQIGHAIKMSTAPAQYKYGGVMPGANNEEVLQSLGLTAEENKAIKASGAFGAKG